MLFLLIRSSQAWLDAHGLGFLRVFTFVTFQATVAVVISFLFCMILGPGVIAWLRKQKVSDQAKFDRADMDNPFGHSGRRISDFYAGLTGKLTNTQAWKRLRITPHTHNPVDDAMGNVEAFERIFNGER